MRHAEPPRTDAPPPKPQCQIASLQVPSGRSGLRSLDSRINSLLKGGNRNEAVALVIVCLVAVIAAGAVLYTPPADAIPAVCACKANASGYIDCKNTLDSQVPCYGTEPDCEDPDRWCRQ
jgi:hypothetical protein